MGRPRGEEAGASGRERGPPASRKRYEIKQPLMAEAQRGSGPARENNKSEPAIAQITAADNAFVQQWHLSLAFSPSPAFTLPASLSRFFPSSWPCQSPRVLIFLILLMAPFILLRVPRAGGLIPFPSFISFLTPATCIFLLLIKENPLLSPLFPFRHPCFPLFILLPLFHYPSSLCLQLTLHHCLRALTSTLAL